MSGPKNRHFVALKHAGEAASYLNDDRDPFKGSHVSRCVLEVLLWDHHGGGGRGGNWRLEVEFLRLKIDA